MMFLSFFKGVKREILKVTLPNWKCLIIIKKYTAAKVRIILKLYFLIMATIENFNVFDDKKFKKQGKNIFAMVNDRKCNKLAE